MDLGAQHGDRRGDSANRADRIGRYRMVTVVGDLQAMKVGLADELSRARGAVGTAESSVY